MNNAIEYIKSDCFRYTGKCDIKSLFHLYMRNATYRWQVAFRLYQSNSKAGGVLGRLLWKLSRTKKSIQIGKQTRIGYGLYIGHGGPIVVNPTAILGDNCNLSQFVTIGSNHNAAARIGNNVYIGPNVCIVENVEIGSNVTLGAGSVVTKNIPDNATAAGNYARVLNYDNPGRYISRRWNK